MANGSQDTATDSDVTNDDTVGSVGTGPWVGDKGLVELDPKMDIPIASPLIYAGSDLSDGWDNTDLAAIGGIIGSLGITAWSYAADPLNAVLNAGLTFLIDVIQPLEDLLGLITGNPERILSEITKWERVATAMGPLSDEIRTAANDDLLGWQGEAGTAAKTRLNELADGVAGLANDASQLMTVLNLAKAAMTVIQSIVIGLIASFVEWLIITWSAAMAAAGPTFGGSTAAAGAATAVRYTERASTTVRYIDKFVTIMNKLRAVLTKMHPKAMSRVDRLIRPNTRGTLVADLQNLRGITLDTLKKPSTYLKASPTPGSYAVGGEARHKRDYGDHSYSDEELDDKLGG